MLYQLSYALKPHSKGSIARWRNPPGGSRRFVRRPPHLRLADRDRTHPGPHIGLSRTRPPKLSNRSPGTRRAQKPIIRILPPVTTMNGPSPALLLNVGAVRSLHLSRHSRTFTSVDAPFLQRSRNGPFLPKK